MKIGPANVGFPPGEDLGLLELLSNIVGSIGIESSTPPNVGTQLGLPVVIFLEFLGIVDFSLGIVLGVHCEFVLPVAGIGVGS